VEENDPSQLDILGELRDCAICPRLCHADRLSGRLGYCQSGAGFSVGAICAHHGEEPALSGSRGICNVFFTRCNLQCIFCQNIQISRTRGPIHEQVLSLDAVVERIAPLLDGGISMLGFVSPSHCIPQMRAIVARLKMNGFSPTVVMNTNAYDRRETLRSLEGLVDVFLPDLKYMDPALAASYSDAADYPDAAIKALKEMYRQKGRAVLVDSEGLMRSGLIVRHLVLPGHVDNSLRCLRAIARELSPEVHLSLLAQYHPIGPVHSHPQLGCSLRPEEYEQVLAEMDGLGFENGWTQELDSQSRYLPDFATDEPFAES